MANASLTLLESDGTTETTVTYLDVGRQAAAASKSLAMSTEDKTVLDAVAASLATIDNPDKGSGTGGSETQRVIIDSAQMGSLGSAARASGVPVTPAHLEYETVAASQTNQMLGATGNVADYIEGLICVVSTAATSQVQVKDGNGTAFTVLPNAVGGGVGTYYVPLGLKCVNATTPGWQVTTAAGVAVIATGDFT